MSAAIPHYIVPTEKYNMLETKANEASKPHQPSKSDPIPSSPVLETKDHDSELDDVMTDKSVSDSESDSSASPRLSPQTKNLVKSGKMHSKVFEKFIHAVKRCSGDTIEFPNLESLIKGALSQSSKEEDGEADFYRFLQKHNLMYFVKNRK